MGFTRKKQLSSHLGLYIPLSSMLQKNPFFRLLVICMRKRLTSTLAKKIDAIVLVRVLV